MTSWSESFPVHAPDPLEIAYLAGVIDSDGYIVVQRARKANTGRAQPNVYYSIKVGIAGTRTPPHELAKAIFGGNIQRYQPKNPAHRAQFQWQISGPVAAAALFIPKPHLRVKCEQAEIAIDFQNMIERHVKIQRATQTPPYRVTPEMQVERAALWEKMGPLNQSRRAGRLLDGRTHDEMPTRSA